MLCWKVLISESSRSLSSGGGRRGGSLLRLPHPQPPPSSGGSKEWQPAPSSPPSSSPGHTHPFIREWIRKAEYILGKDCVYIIFPFFSYFVFNVLLSWKFSFVDELKIATILRGNLNNSWKEGRFCTFYQEWRILLRGLGILKTLPLLWRGPQEYRIK